MSDKPISIIMGSQSDWDTMQNATIVLDALQITYDIKIVSAHRTPKRLYEYADAIERSSTAKVVIAGAGGAAHLPGMFAALCSKPVVAVPVSSKQLKGLDSLLSIVQMPKGVAVATQAIGASGAFNAGLMAAQILAVADNTIYQKLLNWRQQQTDSIKEEVIR